MNEIEYLGDKLFLYQKENEYDEYDLSWEDSSTTHKCDFKKNTKDEIVDVLIDNKIVYLLMSCGTCKQYLTTMRYVFKETHKY